MLCKGLTTMTRRLICWPFLMHLQTILSKNKLGLRNQVQQFDAIVHVILFEQLAFDVSNGIMANIKGGPYFFGAEALL